MLKCLWHAYWYLTQIIKMVCYIKIIIYASSMDLRHYKCTVKWQNLLIPKQSLTIPHIYFICQLLQHDTIPNFNWQSRPENLQGLKNWIPQNASLLTSTFSVVLTRQLECLIAINRFSHLCMFTKWNKMLINLLMLLWLWYYS